MTCGGHLLGDWSFRAFARIGCTTYRPLRPKPFEVYNVTLSTWRAHEALSERFHLRQLEEEDNMERPIVQRDLEDAYQLMAQTVWF